MIEKFRKIYALLIVMFPILSVYSSGINSLSIADFLLILVFIFGISIFFLSEKKIRVENIVLLILSMYILAIFSIQYTEFADVSLFSTFRYLLYLLTIIFLYEQFDILYALKVLRYLTVIVSIYIIIQFIFFKLFTIILPNYLSFLSIMDQNFLVENRNMYFLQFYRPTSIFLEPTHYVQFCLPYLFIILFDKERKNNIEAIIIVLGILVSGSSLGFIMILGFMFFKFIYWIIDGLSVKTFLVLLVFLVLGVYLFNTVPYLTQIVDRMRAEDGSFRGAAVGYRFNNINEIIKGNLFIGRGRGTEEGYLPAVFYIINAHGFIGLLLYILYFLVSSINKTKIGKAYLIIVCCLSIGSEYIINFGLLYYMLLSKYFVKDEFNK